MSRSIYLDYASATPVSLEVVEAMRPYLSDRFYNPSAIYLAGRQARQDLESARTKVAGYLGAKPAEIVFTAGATEANNLAISGVMKQFPEGEILTSAIEHESVLEPAGQFPRRIIPVTQQGIVDLQKLQSMLSEKTVLVSIMYVNNELGSVQPLKEISQILNKLSKNRKSDLPLYLHTDAAQAGNCFDLHIARLGVDLLSLNGGKIYGPKQSGALYVKAGIRLKPLILGGGQEFGLRSGTENLAGAVGLATALGVAQGQWRNESQRLTKLRLLFANRLSELIPGVIINGSPKHQSPHLLSVTLPIDDNERLIMELDEAGIQASAGSACAASSDQPSHVLMAIKLADSEARATLRFSFGHQTTENDIHKTVECLAKLVTNR